MRKFQIVAVIVCLLIANTVFLPRAFAGTLTNTSILEIGGTSNANAMIASAGQAFVVAFTTASAGATTMSINFNSFSGGTVNATQSISSTGCNDYFGSATPLPGTLSASGSGNTISVTGITSLSASTTYCTVLTSVTAITNPSTPGVYSALVTVGADSDNVAFDVLGSNANTITITAVIAPTFTLSLSGTTDSISTLSATSTVVSTGITATVGTNAVSGWFLWAKDSNDGLHSTNASHTIASVAAGSNHTMTTGSEQYALGVSAFNTTNYAYNSGTTGGALSSTAFNTIASNNAAANGVTTVLHELVDISPTSPPATDYTDTITVIGAGSF